MMNNTNYQEHSCSVDFSESPITMATADLSVTHPTKYSVCVVSGYGWINCMKKMTYNTLVSTKLATSIYLVFEQNTCLTPPFIVGG